MDVCYYPIKVLIKNVQCLLVNKQYFIDGKVSSQKKAID